MQAASPCQSDDRLIAGGSIQACGGAWVRGSGQVIKGGGVKGDQLSPSCTQLLHSIVGGQTDLQYPSWTSVLSLVTVQV